MKVDIALKRGAFNGKVNSLLQEFHTVSPDVFIKQLSKGVLKAKGFKMVHNGEILMLLIFFSFFKL